MKTKFKKLINSLIDSITFKAIIYGITSSWFSGVLISLVGTLSILNKEKFFRYDLFIEDYSSLIIDFNSIVFFIASLWLSSYISYYLARHKGVHAFLPILLSALFIIIFALFYNKVYYFMLFENRYLGIKNILNSVIISIFSFNFYLFLENKLKMSDSDAFYDVVNDNSLRMENFESKVKKRSLSNLANLKVIIIIILFVPVSFMGSYVLSFFNYIIIPELCKVVIYPALDHTKMLFGFIYLKLFVSIFWFFGFNGDNLIFSIVPTNYIYKNLDKTGFSQLLGFVNNYNDIYYSFGGSGSTLAAICYIVFFYGPKLKKNILILSILSLVFSLFNINDLFILYFPVFLNPILLLPFLFTPLVNIFLTYIFYKLNLIFYTDIHYFWTTPGFYAAYYSYYNVFNVLLYLLVFVVDLFCYRPFIDYWIKISKEKDLY